MREGRAQRPYPAQGAGRVLSAGLYGGGGQKPTMYHWCKGTLAKNLDSMTDLNLGV